MKYILHTISVLLSNLDRSQTGYCCVGFGYSGRALHIHLAYCSIVALLSVTAKSQYPLCTRPNSSACAGVVDDDGMDPEHLAPMMDGLARTLADQELNES